MLTWRHCQLKLNFAPETRRSPNPEPCQINRLGPSELSFQSRIIVKLTILNLTVGSGGDI